jgi:hypothetical protein
MALAVGYGEFLIGISLLIGLFSRVASLFGSALMLAMWLSGSFPGPHASILDVLWSLRFSRSVLPSWQPANRRGGFGAPRDFCRTPRCCTLCVTFRAYRTPI